MHLRLTQSRRTVVEILAKSNRALSPLEVYELACEQNASLGLVTVYRTLEKLEEWGLIQRVHQPQGCQAFVAALTGHQHLILCSRCGKADYFSGNELDGLFTIIGRQTGYQVKEHWLQLFDVGSECQT